MDRLIKALTELEKLKTVERGTEVNGRKESTAEHSWGCIMIAGIRNINNDSKTNEDDFNEVLIRNKYYTHVGKFKITEQLFDFFMTKLISENKL